VIQTPKTINAYRAVDLYPPVAKLLREFIGGRESGFIFETRNGRPIGTRNFLRLLYANLETLGLRRRGFHAFRRYRNTHLRNRHCPPGLTLYWMAHSARSMSDHYDRSFEDGTFRSDVANSVGVGFEVPERLNAKDPGTQPKQEEQALLDVTSEVASEVSR
jgi:integrase